MSKARNYWILFAITLGVYAAMVLIFLPKIAAEAGGLTPFDMRPMGYTAIEARAFLAALSDAGREIYRGPQHRLDMVYPLLLALCLGWGAVLLMSSPIWRALICFAALGGMAADYVENMRVAVLLDLSPDAVTDAQIAAAARATVAKSALTTIAMIGICVALLGIAWHRTKGKLTA